MSIVFFSSRRKFDFSNDTLDIGNWWDWRREQLNRFLYLKIYQIGGSRFPDFYQYHLKYYQSSQPGAEEQVFHKYLWDLLTEDLSRLKLKSPYAKGNAGILGMREVLNVAIGYLESIDRWNNSETKESIIIRQQMENAELEARCKQLVNELKEARRLETSDYMVIADGYLDTFLDLMLQLQDLTLPDGKELVFSQTQAAWMKMICKHFKEGDKAVKLNSIARYFPADKRNPGVKHAAIKEKFKLFQIKNTAKRS
ncbi:hypothetical protein HDC92_004784 [Pedobacter sp. AK017]|uniref:hypothetical protein n=1 Tax=Pedobacter sp. AK017 TaxID=2723073 RepID=UPI001608F0CB|nr:hypothetical protein [Pedobacter sp. AK017]MBB5441079.1 hypothetical protein [Pedobacter sp. AK017]